MSDVVDKIKRCEVGMGVRKIEDYGTMFTVAEQVEVRDYIESLEKQLASQISNNTKETHLQNKFPEKELAQLIYCLEGRREDLSNDNHGDARNWIRHIDNAYSAMVDATE